MSTASRGIIDPKKFYRFPEFSETSGVGKAGLRTARREGLKVKYIGRHGWILGQWWIDYVESNGKDSR